MKRIICLSIVTLLITVTVLAQRVITFENVDDIKFKTNIIMPYSTYNFTSREKEYYPYAVQIEGWANTGGVRVTESDIYPFGDISNTTYTTTEVYSRSPVWLKTLMKSTAQKLINKDMSQ